MREGEQWRRHAYHRREALHAFTYVYELKRAAAYANQQAARQRKSAYRQTPVASSEI